jgi:hypothetical protein
MIPADEAVARWKSVMGSERPGSNNKGVMFMSGCIHWYDYCETSTGGPGEWCRASKKSTLCIGIKGRCECGKYKTAKKASYMERLEASHNMKGAM